MVSRVVINWRFVIVVPIEGGLAGRMTWGWQVVATLTPVRFITGWLRAVGLVVLVRWICVWIRGVILVMGILSHRIRWDWKTLGFKFDSGINSLTRTGALEGRFDVACLRFWWLGRSVVNNLDLGLVEIRKVLYHLLTMVLIGGGMKWRLVIIIGSARCSLGGLLRIGWCECGWWGGGVG